MPSLKMKTQSTTGCLKEKKGLHVCQKSNKISKGPLSCARIAQNAELLDTLIHSSQEASLYEKQFTKDSLPDEANHGELPEAEDLVLQKESPSSDLSPVSREEFASTICASSTETIFSPNQESTDISSESFVHTDGGYDDLYVPQLETDDSDDSSRGSCKYKTCSMSDFYFSDMIVSGITAEGSSIYDDSIDIKFLHDYSFDEPTMFFDMSKDYMVMPSLEDTMNNDYAQDNRTCRETSTASGDLSLYQAIHQVRSCNQESDVSNSPDWDQAECFDPQMFIRNLPDLPDVASNLQPPFSGRETQKSKTVTLVLDLDETLVHSTLEPCEDADFTFSVFFNMKEHTVYVKQRPHLQTFLERVAEMFEVVIFTASQSIYAKQLLDILDPDGKLISWRAYRESCIFLDGSYTKDLTILGIDLAKVVIIDNSPQVFRLQVNNGIPIKSWFDDPLDSALISLLPFLERLADADDVRPIIAERFGNKE